MAISNINEKLTIKKEDTILAKLIKFCVWLSIICCFLIFAITWLIFFIIFGGFVILYKSIQLPIKHHRERKNLKYEQSNKSQPKDIITINE